MNKLHRRIQLGAAVVVFAGGASLASADPQPRQEDCSCAEFFAAYEDASQYCQPGYCPDLLQCWVDEEHVHYQMFCYESPTQCYPIFLPDGC